MTRPKTVTVAGLVLSNTGTRSKPIYKYKAPGPGLRLEIVKGELWSAWGEFVVAGVRWPLFFRTQYERTLTGASRVIARRLRAIKRALKDVKP